MTLTSNESPHPARLLKKRNTIEPFHETHRAKPSRRGMALANEHEVERA